MKLTQLFINVGFSGCRLLFFLQRVSTLTHHFVGFLLVAFALTQLNRINVCRINELSSGGHLSVASLREDKGEALCASCVIINDSNKMR